MPVPREEYISELQNELGTLYHRVNEDGTCRSVFHYQIPFPPEKEAIILEKYGIRREERLIFYQNIAYCVQRHVNTSAFLANAGVPSILTFFKVDQDQSKSGVSNIYLECEQVWPIRERLLSNAVSAVTLMDIIYRLASILRFANSQTKEPTYVVHRGFDLNEVYINAEDKILLGGFYYSACPGMEPPPDYLPMKPANLPDVFLRGETGTQGTDIQALAIAAWNLFSGLPYNAPMPKERFVYPEYITEDILSALLLGFSGDPATCNGFRRRFQEARKLLLRSDMASMQIPIRIAREKEYIITHM